MRDVGVDDGEGEYEMWVSMRKWGEGVTVCAHS